MSFYNVFVSFWLLCAAITEKEHSFKMVTEKKKRLINSIGTLLIVDVDLCHKTLNVLVPRIPRLLQHKLTKHDRLQNQQRVMREVE